MSDQTTYKRQVTRREVTPKGESSSDREQNQRSDQRADQSASQRSSSNRGETGAQAHPVAGKRRVINNIRLPTVPIAKTTATGRM